MLHDLAGGFNYKCISFFDFVQPWCQAELQQLEFTQVFIKTSGNIHQLIMGSLFGNPAMFKHYDSVGFPDGRQAMGDHDRGPAFHQVLQSFLYQPFRF
jgi:hypothetical protein